MADYSIEAALLAKLRELPGDQQRKVLDFASSLRTNPKRPRKSLHGLWKDSGVSTSDEDIAAARKDMWGNFPR